MTPAVPIYLDSLCYALGPIEETVEEAEKLGLLLSSSAALREAGFGRHHRCRPNQPAYDLAKQAVTTISEQLDGIGAIVYATSLPINGNMGSEDTYLASRDVKHLMDFPVSHLQADFRLDGAEVFGVNQLACTSLLGAIRLARMLLVARPSYGKILCITADRFPKGALYEQAYNLISDGAAGCIVSTNPGRYRMLGEHAITNGAMSLASDDETIGSFLTYTHRLISEALAQANLTIGDLHWIVSQNLNSVTWKVLCSLLRFDRERVLLPTVAHIGHMISGDNIVNLSHLEQQQMLAAGERVLLPMAGYGLNWHCVLLEKQ